MEVVIIGCGLIGVKRAQSIKGVNLVGCADVNISSAEAFSKKFGNIPYFNSAKKLLENTKAQIVIICTPHDKLPELIKEAVMEGRHILVEKPAGRFATELEDIVLLAKEKGSNVRIGFNHRYHRAFRKAKEIANSGALGDIYFSKI